MNLLLQREILTDKSTIGRLYVDALFDCYTLEDVVRETKVAGETAIPAGRYEVKISFSNRFQRDLPILINVPNFSGIRIHPGNTDKDTEGCILVGLTKDVDFIGKSQMAMSLLFPKIQAAINDGQECWIEIRNPNETPPMLEIS